MTALAPRPKYDSVKFTNPGDSVTGLIVDFADAPVNVYNSNPPIPEYWDEAKTRPKMQTRVTVQVEGRHEPVNLWVKPGAMTNAVRDALTAAKAGDIEADGIISMTYVRNDPDSKNPANPKKLFAATYEPPFDPTA